MYSSGLSKVSKYGPQAQNKMYRSKGQSCSYYMRIIFFFSSLIQSLIIVSLVLFLVYGKTQDSASEDRILDLEQSFSRLSMENVALKQQRKNLTNLLNATMTAKASNDLDLIKLRQLCNMTVFYVQEYDKSLQMCNSALDSCNSRYFNNHNCQTPQRYPPCNCGAEAERLKAKLDLVESNFTQTTQRMRMETDQIAKDRDRLNLDVIQLRREKSIQEKELQLYKEKSREEFSNSVNSVSSVSRAFLQKIESLFPSHLAFQLSCSKQREHLEQIRSNCTSLSREVEDKLQHYLNTVGNQVSDIQTENNRLKAENWRLSEDYRWCSQNRTDLIEQHRRKMEELQLKHDQEKEGLLLEKMKLIGQVVVLENTVKYKNKEIDHLMEKIKLLNMSCVPKTASQFPWGSSSSSSVGGLGRTGQGALGSTGSAFNRPASTGIGSSSSFSSPGSGPSLGSTGSVFNKPASTGMGSSSSFSSLGSSPGLGSSGTALNKPGSGGAFSTFGSTGSNPNLSSGGLGLNQPAQNARGSFGLGSSDRSIGSGLNLGSTSLGSNKPTGFGLASSSTGTNGATGASGSAGSTSKSGSPSSGFSLFGFGSSNSGQSKTGSVPGRGTSSGPGSSFGTGRTNGVANVQTPGLSQHLQDMQRLLNGPGKEDKESLTRIMG